MKTKIIIWNVLAFISLIITITAKLNKDYDGAIFYCVIYMGCVIVSILYEIEERRNK